jgi:hypothetical protein
MIWLNANSRLTATRVANPVPSNLSLRMPAPKLRATLTPIRAKVKVRSRPP